MRTEKIYTLDEYISKPLDISGVRDYESTRSKCNEYEKIVNRINIATSILFGISLSFCISLLPGDSHLIKLVFIGVCAAVLFYVPTLFFLGGRSLNKFPMSLVIDGNDYILGTVGSEFEHTDIDDKNIADGSNAKNLLNAIHSINRKPYAFEKKLIQKLVSV